MMIHYDSRCIKKGDVFLAMPGFTVDGRTFMQQAVNNSASKIYYEEQGIEQFTLPTGNIPLIPIKNLSEHQGLIAAEFYDFPSRELTLIGITGTNGKTSISYFIAQCLPNAAVLGTTGYGVLTQLKKLTHTTPAAPDVQRILRELVNEHITSVAMEVSSHALVQHRVEGVDYDYAVFTNLSRDHLDFHGSMENYALAKKKLFSWASLKGAIINIDDSVGQDIVEQYRDHYAIITYALKNKKADIHAINIKPRHNGFSVDLHTPWGRDTIHIPLLGLFNIQNCMAVIGVLGQIGLTLNEIALKIAGLHSAPGRMEFISIKGQPTVVVDFAHTPDALKQTLQALREHGHRCVYCVFGCGGDRDPGKRPLMGAVASRFSDYVIVTNDNPRHESPDTIAAAITEAISPDKLLATILDRRQALSYALETALPDDVILVAGKGHEDYQIMGDEVLPFNDKIVVSELLESRCNYKK